MLFLREFAAICYFFCKHSKYEAWIINGKDDENLLGGGKNKSDGVNFQKYPQVVSLHLGTGDFRKSRTMLYMQSTDSGYTCNTKLNAINHGEHND